MVLIAEESRARARARAQFRRVSSGGLKYEKLGGQAEVTVDAGQRRGRAQPRLLLP